jgi:hypothetical protein
MGTESRESRTLSRNFQYLIHVNLARDNHFQSKRLHMFPDFLLRDPLEVKKIFRGSKIKKFLARKLSYHILTQTFQNIQIHC